MPRLLLRAVLTVMLLAGAAQAASAQTCVGIDESYDTLAPDERTAAVLLVKKALVAAGQGVDSRECQSTYTLSHIRLGRTILVTLSGAQGSREGQALGLDDLPAVYSQLVRSLLTGHPMGSLAVLDRGNVSEAQDRAPRRVQSDGYWHARIGSAALFGPTVEPMAAFGFGTLEQHIRLNPHDTRALYIGAQNLWHVGEQKKAIDLAEQALGQGQDEPMVLYNVACLYTTQGNTQRALDLLEEAVRRGFGDRAWMETDSDLEPLRHEPRFQALLAGIH